MAGDTIVLQFSTSTEFSSEIIRRLCHSDFSHVDWVTPEGLYGSSDPGGVKLRGFNYQRFLTRHNATIPVSSEQAALFSKLMWAENGKAFDKKALWTFLDDSRTDGKIRNWRDPTTWLCSELFTVGLEKINLFLKPLIVAKDRVSPADLLLRINDYIDVDAFAQSLPLDWTPDWKSVNG